MVGEAGFYCVVIFGKCMCVYICAFEHYAAVGLLRFSVWRMASVYRDIEMISDLDLVSVCVCFDKQVM